MTYTAFDSTKPSGSQAGTALPSSVNNNEKAIRDMVVLGGDGSLAWAYSQAGADSYRPTSITLSNGALRQRWTLTWSGNTITNIIAAYSSDSGGTYDTVGTFTFSFSGQNVVGGNVGALGLARLIGVTKQLYDLIDAYNAHAALTGAAAHGLGTISTQNSNNVLISGGTIAGINLYYTFSRGTKSALGSISGTVNLDWQATELYTATLTGATTFTCSNLPNGGLGSLVLELTNPGAYTLNWPSGSKFPGGIAPTRTVSGKDLYEMSCHDGSNIVIVQAAKDFK